MSDTAPANLLVIADAAVDLVIARVAGSSADPSLTIETKSSRTDMVTSMDRWVEKTLVDSISRARPNDGFLGEEGSSVESATGVTWVIDPIDGTTNFVYDIPGYSVSVAASISGSAVAGLVHDPVRGERFRATIGGGATRNGEPISAGGATDLSTSLVATGFSYDRERRRAQAEALVNVLPAVRDIRRLGGAALDLCALACGRIDAYYERGLSPWDTAAGALIAAEAGAIIDFHLDDNGAFVGASPLIYEAFCRLLESAGVHAA